MGDIDYEALYDVTGDSESRNRDYYASGAPVRSSAGAMYKMQVLPSTARDPGFGVRPASGDNPDEYNRVGRDLIRSFTRRYGDPKTAWAAYNWGPGRVDRAQQRFGSGWFDHIPAGVQQYATTNANNLARRAGPPPPQQGAVMANYDPNAADPESGLGGLDRASLLKDYQGVVSDAKQWQLDASAQRKAQLEAGLAALQRQHFGPSAEEQLAMWSNMFLSPTRVPGFKGLMMNMAPMALEMASGRRKAEEDRNAALRELQARYSTGELGDRKTAIDMRREAIRDQIPLVKEPSDSYSATPTGVIFNKRTGYPMPAPAHVNALLGNPGMARDFDIKFGPGAAKEVLSRYGGQQ